MFQQIVIESVARFRKQLNKTNEPLFRDLRDIGHILADPLQNGCARNSKRRISPLQWNQPFIIPLHNKTLTENTPNNKTDAGDDEEYAKHFTRNKRNTTAEKSAKYPAEKPDTQLDEKP